MAQAPVSPLTGILEEDTVIIDFGDHEGKSVLEVSDTHPEFYDQMIEFKNRKGSEFTIRRDKDKYYRLNMNISIGMSPI
ncbi:MAG: hypothetical protein OXB88_01975 [Bacteriovoracales bacterium]|nr:hypothetical protein [Bacteriovoracales bacterium]